MEKKEYKGFDPSEMHEVDKDVATLGDYIYVRPTLCVRVGRIERPSGAKRLLHKLVGRNASEIVVTQVFRFSRGRWVDIGLDHFERNCK